MLSFTKTTLLVSTSLSLALVAAAQDEPVETIEDSRTLDTVVVRGEFIPEPQRQTSQVASFLSSADLERQGDANAALALTRLSGLSVVGGKFAYVRGLGDRYSYALLNGSLIPSPEPLRRTVPLDLFPSSILEGAAVQKTYSANYGADFGGGVIDLNTLKSPSEPFFEGKISGGYNSFSTLEDRLAYQGGADDWLGWDDGTRDVPGPIAQVFRDQIQFSELSAADREIAGESLANGRYNVITEENQEFDWGAELTGGTVYEKGDVELGLLFAAGFDRASVTREAERNLSVTVVTPSGIVGSTPRSANVRESNITTTANALGTATLFFDDPYLNGTHELSATGLVVRQTDKQAQISAASDFNTPGGAVREDATGWYEREMLFGQLAGEHNVFNFDISWRASHAETTRWAPYEFSLQRELVDSVPLYNVTNNNSIAFGDLEDIVRDYSGEVAREFELPGGRMLTLTAGGGWAETERFSLDANLLFLGGSSLTDEEQALAPDLLFGDALISPADFQIGESLTTSDNYYGLLEVVSGFAQADFDITDFIQGTLGVRIEDGEQTVLTFSRLAGATTSNLGQPGAITQLENGVDAALGEDPYILPAATLTWNFADNLQLRLGYSETITRPQFRELAGTTFLDPDSDRVYRGNPNLVDSELTNYDARLEYYMGRNQFVTGAVFYKEIINPIEEVQFQPATNVFQTSFVNAPKAELQGIELEYRNRFEMPFDIQWLQERDWLFSTNYTFTDSELSASDSDTVISPLAGVPVSASIFGFDGQQLQGAPENILNVQFGWESDVDQATLLVGWVDERILQRGIQGLSDVVEDPGVQVDLVYNRDFQLGPRDMTLGLSARNLLDEKNEEFQENAGSALGRTEFNTYERGISLSASLTAKF